MRTVAPTLASLALAVVAASVATAADRLDFATPSALPAFGGTPATAMASRDFDGDGLVDVAVACTSESGLTFLRVFLAEGPRRFDSGTNWPVASRYPTGLEVVEADADGLPDLLSLDSTKAIVQFGDGTGAFVHDERTEFPGVGVAWPGDIDADGLVDVFRYRTDTTPRTFTAHLADGAGFFVSAAPVPASLDTPVLPKFADLDGDGDTDVLLPADAGLAESRLDLLRGDGLGGFGPIETIFASLPRARFFLHDADADGDLDLFAAESSSPLITAHENDGTGAFSAREAYATVVDPDGQGRVLDANGDGMPDIVVPTPSSLVVLPGTGAPFGFGTPEIHPIVGGTLEVGWTLDDFDGDGALDFFQPIDMTGPAITYGRPGGRFGSLRPDTHPAGIGPTSIATGDLNGDGRADLGVANRGPDAGSGSLTVLLGKASPGFTPLADVVPGSRPETVVFGDFDGDGRTDAAVGKVAGSDAVVLFGDGTGALTNLVPLSFLGPVDALRTLDANEDGVDDLVACVDLPGGTYERKIVLRLADGARGFDLPVEISTAPPAATGLATGDVDLDGHADVIAAVFAFHFEPFRIQVSHGDGSGGFPWRSYALDSSGLPVAVADVDGDGIPDIVTSQGVVESLGPAGLGPFHPITGFAVELAGLARGGVADFDGDGRLDLAGIGGPSSHPDPAMVGVSRHLGDFEFDTPSYFATVGGAAGLAIADFDADCHPDIAAATTSGVTILRNRSFDALAVRVGTVNAGAGPVVDVLFANGSPGAGVERRVVIDRTDPFELRMDAAPSLVSCAFVLYVWLGEPNGGTVQPLPHGLGRIAMPTPLHPNCRPKPRHIWNNIGFRPLLGAPTLPSSPAPSVVVSAPGGLGGRVVAYLQGFIRDDDAPNGKAAVTNGLVLDVR